MEKVAGEAELSPLRFSWAFRRQLNARPGTWEPKTIPGKTRRALLIVISYVAGSA